MCMFSVEANSRTANIWVYVMTTKNGQSHKILHLGFQKFIHFAGKFGWGPQLQDRVLLRLCMSLTIHAKS